MLKLQKFKLQKFKLQKETFCMEYESIRVSVYKK